METGDVKNGNLAKTKFANQLQTAILLLSYDLHENASIWQSTQQRLEKLEAKLAAALNIGVCTETPVNT